MRLSAKSDYDRYGWADSLLRGLVAGAPSNLVFDIGAGDCRMRPSVEAAYASYAAFDLKSILPDVSVWDLDRPLENAMQRAGGALLLDVIEHCNNPGFALHNIAGALLPGAFVIITTPNPLWSRSRWHALFKGVPICFTQSDLDLNHHVFTAWPHILEEQLRTAGFSVEQYVTLDGWTVWPGFQWDWRYPRRLLSAGALKAVEYCDRTACGMSYGIVARILGA